MYDISIMITTFSISQYLSAALSSLLQKHAFWLTSTFPRFHSNFMPPRRKAPSSQTDPLRPSQRSAFGSTCTRRPAVSLTSSLRG